VNKLSEFIFVIGIAFGVFAGGVTVGYLITPSTFVDTYHVTNQVILNQNTEYESQTFHGTLTVLDDIKKKKVSMFIYTNYVTEVMYTNRRTTNYIKKFSTNF
jgi:hypothetical protein